MNAVVILLVGIVILVLGYIFYGGWLAKQWGVDPKRTTPAHELEDGNDYVPAKAPVLMGHHFSSIAGAGSDQRADSGGCIWLGAGYALGTDRWYLLWSSSRFRCVVCICPQ